MEPAGARAVTIEEQRAAAKRTALILGAVALAVFVAFILTGGYFLGNHLYGDESKVRAAQATLRIGEGKAVNYRAAVSWIEFGDLDTLAREGLGRTNAVVPGDGYANDFDLLDIQLEAGFTVYDWPVRMRLDFVQNVAADEDGFAGRGDLVIGDSFRRPGLEAGIAMHILNNFLAFGFALSFGDLTETLNVAEASWWNIPLTLTQAGTYAVLVLLLAKRRGLQTRTTPPPGLLSPATPPRAPLSPSQL